MAEFINISNHPSEKWSVKQREAAHQYGNIVDIPFPNIPPSTTDSEIDKLVKEHIELLSSHDVAAVMIQGEFVFTYRMVTLLKNRGITVISSCSERRTVGFTDAEGKTQRLSEFEFVKFREY